MYMGKMVLPTMLLVIMALSNPSLFEKYFMRTLLWLNIIVVALYSLKFVDFNLMQKTGEGGIERMIWLSRSIGICVAYFVITSSWKKRPLVTIPLIIFLFGVMIYIGSRGPVLSLILALGFFLIIKNRKNIGPAVLLAGVVGIVVVAFMTYSPLTDFARSFATHGKTKEFSHFGEDRLSAYTPSLLIFADHPLVGVGLGKWWSTYQKKFRIPPWEAQRAAKERMKGHLAVLYPHNILLEILSELGIIGLACFILLFVPFKRLFSMSNEYNILCLLGFLYAWSSSDITQNSAPMIFNLLSILRARDLLPPLEFNNKLLENKRGLA